MVGLFLRPNVKYELVKGRNTFYFLFSLVDKYNFRNVFANKTKVL